MTSTHDIANIPTSNATGAHPLLSQLADVRPTTVPGKLDRQNALWMLALSANLGNNDLNAAAKEINRASKDADTPPRGVTATVRGHVSALSQIFDELTIGLAAVIAVILLLTATFQSLRLSAGGRLDYASGARGSGAYAAYHWYDAQS